MAWDDPVTDNVTVDYAADHNEQTTQIKSRLVGQLGLATPNNFIIVNAGGTGATPTPNPADLLKLSQLGTPTLSTLQDWASGTQSGGRIYGGVLSAGTAGTVNISALKGMIKTGDYTVNVQVPTATQFFDLGAQTNWGTGASPAWLINDNINYIYVDYASGVPVIKSTTDRTTIRYTDQFTLGRVFKDAGGLGASIEILNSGINLPNRTRTVHERWIDTFGGLSHASGIIPSVVTTIGASPNWTLGILYAGSNKIPIDAVTCSGSGGGTFHSFYTADNGTTWVESGDINRIDFANYNNPASGLSPVGVSKYGIHWMYVCPEGDMYFLYGKGSYSLAEATAAQLATPIPNYLSQWCLLVAKVIISRTGVLDSVTSAWTNAFPVSNPANHNDLGNLDYASAAHTGFAPDASPVLTGTATTPALKLTAGAAVGAIPTSDATGVLKYLATGSSGQLPIGSTGATPVWAGLTMGTTTARGLAVTNGAGAITLGLVKAYRTIFLSCAGGWASTTYGDGGSVTTETNATGASPVIFNLKTTLMDATIAGQDRHHEWTAPMPVNWDGGTVTAKPFIMTKGIGVADDTLILGLQGAAIKHGDAASALTFANTATSSIGASAFFTLSATAHGKLISNVGATSAAGVSTLTIGGSAAVAGGDLIQWRMNRPGYDTYASGASVFGWLITYGTLNYSDEV